MHPNEEIEEKRRQRRIRIVSLFIIGLMVLSVGGYYAGSSGGTTQRYNGVKFTAGSNAVLATIEGVRYGFNYFPSQVEDVNTDAGVAALLQSPFLYITYDADSNYSDAMAQIQYYLGDVYNSRGTYPAFGALANNSYQLPIVTCENATAAEPVLAFRESNETSIALQDTCIVVTAESQDDLFRIQDKLVLMRLGVMSE